MTNSVTITNGPFALAGGLMGTLARLDITSYTANGESVSASDFKLNRIFAIAGLGASDTGFVFHWDETNGEVKAFGQDASGTSGTDTVGLAEADSTDDAGEAWVLALGV